MQTSAAIATAAVAQERAPVAILKVDWDANGNYTDAVDDVSARVESLTIDRQLATDLPDEVARSAGYSAAQLTATLSGDPTTEATSAASYFSPFNTASALYGKRRRWRTCQAQIGFGTTLLPVFTGKTTGLMVDSASRTATLEALDLAETMRGVVDLPIVVADDQTNSHQAAGGTGIRPGLNGSWVIDYIARKCGYNAAPPARTGCRFYATFAGSAYPEIGTNASVAQFPGAVAVQFVAGKFAQQTAPSVQLLMQGNLSTALSLNDNGEVLFDGWVKIASTGSAWAIGEVVSLAGAGGTKPRVSLYTTTANVLVVAVTRTAGVTGVTFNTGLTIPTATSTYVGCHVFCTSTTITIQTRVGGTSANTSIATTSVTGQAALAQVAFNAGYDATGAVPGPGAQTALQFEAWQVSNPGLGATAPAWNDAYTGNSIIGSSMNQPVATVPRAASAWDQVQEVAAAELGAVGFDESGNFTFYPRNRWTSAPYTTSQRTINAADSLTAIATSEAIDQVRNHVRVAATTAVINAAGWVWSTANVISVPASGSTTVTVDMGQPVYNLSTSVRYASTSGTTGQSQYRANQAADGSGTAVSNLTFSVSTSAAQIVTIVITNPNAFVVYLVTSAGFTDPAGTPSLALWGKPVDFTVAQQPDTTSTTTTAASTQIIDVSDATSIAQHGDQLLELSGNPWLQNVTNLTTLANDLLARLKDPLPILEGLTIAGDPRLQLGDRVTVVEPTIGLNGDFFLTRIMSTFDANGYTQALTVRGIS